MNKLKIVDEGRNHEQKERNSCGDERVVVLQKEMKDKFSVRYRIEFIWTLRKRRVFVLQEGR